MLLKIKLSQRRDTWTAPEMGLLLSRGKKTSFQLGTTAGMVGSNVVQRKV